MEFLRLLEGIRSPFLTMVFRFLTDFGEESFFLLVLCALYWCINKQLAYGVGISFFVSSMLTQGMKITFRVERPWIIDPAFSPAKGDGILATATGYSFPSGHTQSATALFTYLGLASRKKRVLIACLVLSLLVGFSRMYLGVHTPVDVAVGFLLALTVATLSYWYMGKGFSYTPLIWAMLIGSIGVLVYALTQQGGGVLEDKNLADACKAAGACIGCAGGLIAEHKWIHFSEKTARPWHQVPKFLLGVAVLLGIKAGLKPVLGESLLADAFRYTLMALWALAIYPLIMRRIFPAPVASS